MQVITGAPPAEFGDKTSLVVNTTTRSGMGQTQPLRVQLTTEYGSFGTINQEVALGFGGKNWGSFTAANGMRSGRFLDTPEFQAHPRRQAIAATFFQRFDYQPTGRDMFHLNLFAGAQLVPDPEHLRPGRRGAGPAATGSHVQHRARLPADHRREPAVHRECMVAARTSVGYYAQRESSVGHARHHRAESQACAAPASRRTWRLRKKRHAIKFGMQYGQTGLSEDYSFRVDFSGNQPGMPGWVRRRSAWIVGARAVSGAQTPDTHANPGFVAGAAAVRSLTWRHIT